MAEFKFIYGKNLSVRVKKLSQIGKFFGLMFKKSDTDNLLFDFSVDVDHSIHSFFVFFPFVAVWFTDDNSVICVKVVKPFTFSVNPGKKFRRLLEIPFNPENSEIIDLLVGKGKI